MLRKRARRARRESGLQPARKRRTRGLVTAAVAVTASSMALSPITATPQAKADVIDLICGVGVIRCDFVTAGVLTKPILDIGALIYSIPFLSDRLPPGVVDLPILGPTNVNALIPGLLGKFSNDFFLPDPGAIASGMIGMQASPLGTHTLIGVMDGALTTGQAITTIQNSISPVFGVNNYNYLLVRNPGRANGGMASRFDWLYNLTGIPGSAVSGNVATKQDPSILPCAGGTLCQYIPIKADLGLGYDSMSDFPIAPIASVSILNSVMQSFLLTNYLGDFQIVLQDGGNQNFYLTVVPTDSALLEPLRLAKRLQDRLGIDIPIISTIFADLPNQLANALEPAVDILINVGYSDVDLTTYQRSFTDFNTNKQFFIDSTLTIDQYFTAVGAAFSAAISGLGSIFSGNLNSATTPGGSAATNQPLAQAVQDAVAAALPAAPEQQVAAATPQSPTADQLVSESHTPAEEPATAGSGNAASLASDNAPHTATTAGQDDDRALDKTLSGESSEAATGQDSLDAAADDARARASDVLAGSQDQPDPVSDPLSGSADESPTPSATADASGAGTDSSTGHSGSDAADASSSAANAAA